MIFIHFHGKVIKACGPLMETAYLRMILNVILKIERENATKPQSKHLLLVNWNIENLYSSYEVNIFLMQIKVRSRNNLAIMGIWRLNDFSDLESELKYLNNV